MHTVWYSCDNWNFNASNPCLYGGGNYNQNLNHGLFYVNRNSTSNSNANHGCRNQQREAKKVFIIGTGFRTALAEDIALRERASTYQMVRWNVRIAKRRIYFLEKS